jgi:hypothetical protein
VYPIKHYTDNQEIIAWNEEVNEDFSTVHRTLSNDHEVIDIRIPVELGRNSSRKLLYQALKAITVLSSPPSATHQSTSCCHCHIVLNTHGIPGCHDLGNDLILELMRVLLHRSPTRVKITQISALMCDGMTIPAAVGQEASMKTLQKKLQALCTPPGNAQYFDIRGVSYAYEPSKETDNLVGILLKTVGECLTVSMAEVDADSDSLIDKATILASIEIVRHYQQRKKSDSERSDNNHGNYDRYQDENYIKAGNILSKVMNAMKEDVLIYLQQSEIDEGKDSVPLLYNVLLEHMPSMYKPKVAILNETTLDSVYRHWLKECKLYSEQRLKLLEQFVSFFPFVQLL